MTQAEFINLLNAALASLPAAERAEIIADYQAYFADALAAGRSEAEVAAGLGDPQRLARELCAERKLAQWEASKTPGNLKQVLSAFAALGTLNLLLALPYLTVMTVLAVLCLTAFGVLLSGVLITGSWASNALFGWPASDSVVINDSGSGPWLIGTDGSKAPRLKIEGDHGERFALQLDASSGLVRLEASDGNQRFALERDAQGNLRQLSIQDGAQSLTMNDFPRASAARVLIVGVILLVLGLLGSIVGWKVWRACWRGTGRWLRWQQQLFRQHGAGIPAA